MIQLCLFYDPDRFGCIHREVATVIVSLMFSLNPSFRVSSAVLAGMALVFSSSLVWSQESDASIVAFPLFTQTEGAMKVVYYPAGGGQKERVVATELEGAKLSQGDGKGQSLKLYTKRPEGTNVPSVFGRSEKTNGQIVFYPRFPLQPGIRFYVTIYKEIMDTVASVDSESGELYSFTIPLVKQEPVATVSAVYPSISELPENLLKFYIHFTHPMSGGDAYSHIRLLNEDGNAIELPFLELGEELWDRENLRITLLFDPGRIKSGLMPRREEGAVLESGKRYTLQILNTWKDDQGRPLRDSFEKRFIAIEPDGESPQVETWQMKLPAANSGEPLQVDFPEPLDEALLQRVVEVVRNGGEPVVGQITVVDGERRWQFTPHQPWDKGLYLLRVGTVLEDLAGNSIGRPFEVDLEESEHRRPDPFAYREFQIN